MKRRIPSLGWVVIFTIAAVAWVALVYTCGGIR